MNTESLDIRREFLKSTASSCLSHKLSPPFLGILTLFNMLPAILYSCTGTAEPLKPAGTKSSLYIIQTAEQPAIRNMDIFTFRDDRLQKLDSYQRYDDMTEWKNMVISGSGKRIITVIANSRYCRDDWTRMNSRSYLKQMSVSLEEETREYAAMTGEINIDTGERLPVIGKMTLHPFASEIMLNSISCDFSGKAYAGEKLSDVRIYLTNVNAECGLLEDETSSPKRIINAGRLSEDDLEGFMQPDLIIRDIREEIGPVVMYPDIRLWCYQSNHSQETPGSPYTRLVIEGKVSGQTYYWPININRDTEEEAGIWRNRRYIFDITITRKGSLNPDRPVKTGDIIIKQEIKEWEERKEYEVAF